MCWIVKLSKANCLSKLDIFIFIFTSIFCFFFLDSWKCKMVDVFCFSDFHHGQWKLHKLWQIFKPVWKLHQMVCKFIMAFDSDQYDNSCLFEHHSFQNHLLLFSALVLIYERHIDEYSAPKKWVEFAIDIAYWCLSFIFLNTIQ